MGKVPEIIEAKIKGAASIVDVMEDLGVELHRNGSSYDGLCPFHNDRNLGSFKVSEAKNIATCFSCGKTWRPVSALMEGKGMDYPTALRYLAARYNIFIDDEPVPEVKPAKPREAAPDLPMIWWKPEDIIKPYLGHAEENTLLRYLFALPLTEDDKARLNIAVNDMYFVGTSTNGVTKGWTIWWQIDEQMRVRTGKLMAYKEDGHRDKDRVSPWDRTKTYHTTFVHKLLEKVGKWNEKTTKISTCLFGLHLVDVFPNAEVCIVESEKSAVICSAFCDPTKRLWMATASKSQLKREKLKPLIDRNRYIVLYPDYDGYDEWSAAATRMNYPRISVSPQIKKLHVESDGDKADIADIMLRLVSEPRETMAEKAARRLGCTEDQAENLTMLIDKLNLELID